MGAGGGEEGADGMPGERLTHGIAPLRHRQRGDAVLEITNAVDVFVQGRRLDTSKPASSAKSAPAATTSVVFRPALGMSVLGQGVTLGPGNVVSNGARLFPGVTLPEGALVF